MVLRQGCGFTPSHTHAPAHTGHSGDVVAEKTTLNRYISLAGLVLCQTDVGRFVTILMVLHHVPLTHCQHYTLV